MFVAHAPLLECSRDTKAAPVPAPDPRDARLLSADAARDYAGHRERYLSTNNPLLLHLKTAGRFERILKTKMLRIDTNRCARRGDAFDLLSSMHDLRRDDCTYVNLSVHTVPATV